MLMAGGSVNSVMAIENDYSEVIRAFIYTFEGREEIVTYVRDLKDIFGDVSYQLYAVGEEGYAITQ